jgi:hypothetical protein
MAGQVRAAPSVHAMLPVATPSGEDARRPELVLSAPPARSNRLPADAQDQFAEVLELAAAPRPRLFDDDGHTPLAEGARPIAPLQVTRVAQPLLLWESQSRSPDVVESLPERLLNETLSSAPQTMGVMPMRTAALTASQPRSEQESTEVHVHIGRIEVTAVHEAAAPAKQGRNPRASRPLSDYLARGSRP